MAKLFESAVGPAGSRSWRKFTKSEIAAAKRLDICYAQHEGLHGPLFWATGPYYPEELRDRINKFKQGISDCELILAAWEREGWEAPDWWKND